MNVHDVVPVNWYASDAATASTVAVPSPKYVPGARATPFSRYTTPVFDGIVTWSCSAPFTSVNPGGVAATIVRADENTRVHVASPTSVYPA